MDLAQTGIEENKRLSLGSNAVDVPLRVSAGNDVTVSIKRHCHDVGFIRIVKRGTFPIRGHPIDGAFIPGSHEQTALLIEEKRPDVFGSGIEELFRHTVLDLVNLTVGRSPGIKDVLIVNSERQ